MKRLLLLRHAKASPDGKESKDFDRKLTARGRADSAAMGAWLHVNGYHPDHILCSSAARTRETWKIVSEELGDGPKAEFADLLYLASARRIEGLIREAADAAMLLVIGHNSGLEDCALELARKPVGRDEAKQLETMREKFPTCTLAVLDFDIAEWSEMEAGGGALVEFVRPRDLKP
ncbi:MAG TPA: histidine phosphatase family protein [Rhizomicrobium sp.]|jgi:phosphohistidine phosphatase